MDPTSAPHHAHGYRPDIDGLRAAAVLFVVVYHVFPDLLRGGFVGVDVFFVISGYLITGIVARGLDAGTFSLWTFYQRRIRRIFPALALVLLASLALGYQLLPPFEYAALGKHVTAGALFVPNLVYWGEVDYFDAEPRAKGMLHLWSLGIEEQFYLVWPALLLALSRGRARLHALVFAVASFIVGLLLLRDDPAGAFYSPASRFWELLIGCLLALHLRATSAGNTPGTRGARTAASLGGALLLLLSATLTDERFGFPGFLALAPTGGAALLIWAGPAAVANRLLSHRVVVSLGLVSYPLYLWHWPLLSFAHLRSLDPGLPLVGTGIVAVSVALAFATYRIVELPIRFGRWSRHGVAISTAAMALACIAGAGVYLTGGLPLRMPDALQSVLDHQGYDFNAGARAESCFLTDDAHDFDRHPPRCFIDADGPREGSILLWGDSYAAGLYPGLRSAVEAPRQIAQLNRAACRPALGLGSARCQADNDRTAEAIRRTPPATVLLFAQWQVERSLWEPQSEAARSLAGTLQAISAAGVRDRVVLGPFPVWNGHLPLVLFRHWNQHWTLPARLAARDAGVDARTEANVSRIALQQGASFVSLIDMLCNSEGCSTYVPGTRDHLITWDRGHLTTAGATYVANRLREAGKL